MRSKLLSRCTIGCSLAITTLLLFVSCKPEAAWQAEKEALTQRAAQWERQYEALNVQVDSLWDTTSLQLANALPPDFPAIDRDIFIRARNADHIRMFMSYQQLDSSLHALVDDAGKKDAALAEKMRLLLEEKNMLNDSISNFLVRVSATDVETGRQYSGHFATLDSIPQKQ